MDSRQLLYFCAIVEQKSISNAAKKLHITQSPLSNMLKNLEMEVGQTLINRTTRQFQVTEAGKSFYIKAKKILNAIDELSLSTKNSAISGEVRIGISARCLSFFTKVVPLIEKEYPEITCRILVIDTLSVEMHLKKWDIDFAIILQPAYTHDYHVIPLTPQHYIAAFSQLLEPPPEGPITLRELSRYPLLLTRRWLNIDGSRPLMALFEREGCHPRVVMDTHASYIIWDLLYATPAVGILLNTEIPPMRRNDYPVRDILINLEQHPAIVYLKNMYLSPQAAAVIELVQENSPT